MSEMEQIRVDTMIELMENLGITATSGQVEQLTKDFALHMSMEREMASYGHINYKEPCKECSELKLNIKELEKREAAYRNWFQSERGVSVTVRNGAVERCVNSNYKV